MVTEAGLKDFSFNAVDGGVGAPSATVTTNSTITGAAIDLLDGTNSLLPDAVAFQFAVSHTKTGTGTSSGTTTPTYKVFALWMTGATATPHTLDRERHLIGQLSETTTVTGVTATGPHQVTPSNTRVFPTKGRHLKLLYKINKSAAIAGTLKFGAHWSPLYSKVYSS